MTSDFTEAEIVDRLRARYGRTYSVNGRQTRRYVGASHVRLAPFAASSIADFLVQDVWGNYGPFEQRHPLLGFEIKVSRSDYLREIKNPGKSYAFREVCTEWYLAASHPSIVHDDLPDGWGLMVPSGHTMRVVHRSAMNPAPAPMPRSLMAAFLRAVATQRDSEPVS